MADAQISFGPKLGLLNNAAIGEQYYDQFRPFLRGVDALVQPAVIAASVTTPPVSPNDGDAYLLLLGATGAWAGHQGDVAVYSTQITQSGSNTLQPGWDFYTPKTGWLLWDSEAGGFIQFNGTDWTQFGGGYVLLNPVNNQTVTQPDGTSFGVGCSSSNGTFANIGVGNNSGGPTGSTASVQFNGYIYLSAQSERIVAATYHIGTDDHTPSDPAVSYVCDASSNNIDIYLPVMSGVFNGWSGWFIISRNDTTKSTGHTVTIHASGSNTIAGQASVTLADWGSYTFMYTATSPTTGAAGDWLITAKV